MELSNNVAAWVGSAATAIGLGSLMSQASAIHAQNDPLYTCRSHEFLGPWMTKQPRQYWWRLRRTRLYGPIILASLTGGFCGHNAVRLSRKPTSPVGKTSWAAVLGVIHQNSVDVPISTPKGYSSVLLEGDEEQAGGCVFDPDFMEEPDHASTRSSEEWSSLEMQPLVALSGNACIPITRATLIILLALSNGRTIFKFSGDAGYRASFPSYLGLWTINWPVGKPAMVHLSIHDFLLEPGSDKYPKYFPARTDKCIDMLCGLASDNSGQKVGFPGRLEPGVWVLELQKRGYAGQHGSRHLYNMFSGKVHEVDYLCPRHREASASSQDSSLSSQIEVVSLVDDEACYFVLQGSVLDLLPQTIDNLPWAHVSWSMHRGMRAILIAFGKEIMGQYRALLADTLCKAVETSPQRLAARGWDPEFVRDHMPHMVSATVLAGHGNSGDLIRVITDAALLYCEGRHKFLDRTTFWTTSSGPTPADDVPVDASSMTPDTVIALTKYIVLEWSQELDYQMYHEVPMTLYLE